MSKRHLYILLTTAAILFLSVILAEDYKSARIVRFYPEEVSIAEETTEDAFTFPVMRFTSDEADHLLAQIEAEKEAQRRRETARTAQNVSVQRSQGGTYLGSFYCTAYCPCYECSEGYGNMTATGVRARAYHTIAVDPSVIPYGTKVVIDGVVYTAEDCGGGVNGRHVDIYFDTHYEAMCYDTGYHDVYLY